MEFLISSAMAADAGAGQGGGIPVDIFILIAFALIFYFIVWRPQSKRAKEHRELVSGISKGDEVVTNGGLVGKVVGLDEQFLVLEIANNVQVRQQRGAIAAVLPKGTIKSIAS